MPSTLNWPELPDSHTAVELIDALFEQRGLERTGTITSRYTDSKHTYHHFRIVVPFKGLAAMNENETVYRANGQTVTFERYTGDSMQFLVDTGSLSNSRS